MTINKFQGKTEKEAVEKAKKAMGPDTVIMSVREIKAKGFLSSFKASTYEVTAAVEEKEQYNGPLPKLKSPAPILRQDTISLAADEPIRITQDSKKPPEKREETDPEIKERLKNLQSLLEKQLGEDKEEKRTHPEEKEPEKPIEKPLPENGGNGVKFLKTLYGVLLDNEVDERYANDIIDDMEKASSGKNSIDLLLSNTYQKLVLKFGTPRTIELTGKKPKVVFFIGPTGVGKTTTIAKIASRMKVDQGKKVAFLTADTYRIAAAEQLRTYANILDSPLFVCYSPEEMNDGLSRFKDYDLVLVDTAGFSHRNEAQRKDTKALIEALDPAYEKDVYLVLSAATKCRDLYEIADIYHEIADYKLIFTKLDETDVYGALLNVRLHSGAEISYVTNGQNVPDDIAVFHTQKIVKSILGGR